MVTRCAWISGHLDNEVMTRYHDTEWGKPQHGDQALFELLSLETYQSGLSWSTVINKRENFRSAFHSFDLSSVAAMSDTDFEQLMQNDGIIRNRLKLQSTINNARVILRLRDSGVSFDEWLWAHVGGQQIDHRIADPADIPVTNELATDLAKEMKKLGFKFVGPTTVYSFLQGAGLINDHELRCDFHDASELTFTGKNE
jgi:DNA-3-methyladenine glycosylase I